MNHESDTQEKNLSQTPAIEKIRALAKSARVCLFGTAASGFPLAVRPMGVQDVDEAANLWFLSGRSSIKNVNIARDPRVQLLFANTGDSEYLSLQGYATVYDSRELREKYWSPLAKAWFQGGIDDPELTVIKVQPTSGHYWDTENGKAISLLKIALSAVTGKTMDGGVQGSVRL